MTEEAEQKAQAEVDDWFEDAPSDSPDAQEGGTDDQPLPRDTLRLSRPFPGLKELKHGRTDFFAELVEIVNLEVNRLLRYTMMTYAHPRCPEIEAKAEADAGAATRDIMEHVSEYIDKCVQMLQESKDGSPVELDPAVEAEVLQKQLDESVSQNQDLLRKMAGQEGRIQKLNSMIKKMRLQYYKELESQKDRFRNIIHRYLPELSPEEFAELMQSVGAVQHFVAGDFMDEDTQLAVQQKVQAVEKDFNVEREALNRQIEMLTESEAEARHRHAQTMKRAQRLQYELTKLTKGKKAEPSKEGEKHDAPEPPSTAGSSATESFADGPRASLFEMEPPVRASSGSVFGARRASDTSRLEMKQMMEKVQDVEASKNVLLMQVHATNDLVNKQKHWLETMPQTGEVSVLRLMMQDVLAKTGIMQSTLELEVKPPVGPEKHHREEQLSKQGQANDIKLLQAERELIKSEVVDLKDEIAKLSSKNSELEANLAHTSNELETTSKALSKEKHTVEGLMEVEAPKTQTLQHANTTLRILKMLKWDKNAPHEEMQGAASKLGDLKSLNPQSIDETISELVMDEARRYTLDVEGIKRELEKAQKENEDLKTQKKGWEQERFSFLERAPANLDVQVPDSAGGSSPSGASRPTSSMFTKTPRESRLEQMKHGDDDLEGIGENEFPENRRKAVQFESGFGDKQMRDSGVQTWKPKRRDESTMAYPDRSHAGCQAGQPKGRKRNGPHDKNAVLEWDNQKDNKRGIDFAIQEAQETEIRGLRSEVARLQDKLTGMEEREGQGGAPGSKPWWDNPKEHAEWVHKEAERRRSMRLSDAELAEISPDDLGKLAEGGKVLKKSGSKASPKTSLSVVLDAVVEKANLGGSRDDDFDMNPDMDVEAAEEAARKEELAISEANRLIDGAAHELDELVSEIENDDSVDVEEGMTPRERSAYRVEQAKAMLKQAELQMHAITQANDKLSLWKQAKSTVHVHQKLKNELRVEYEHCLIKKLNEERGRIYRAWPRVASAEPIVRKIAHQLGKKKTLDMEVATINTQVLDQRNEALARIDKARFVTYGKESHLHLAANDARFEDLRDLLESQELFSHYECIGSLTRRLMACRGEFKRMRSRLAGALFESDRLRVELCLLREEYLKEKENVSIIWARQAYWLRRCISELGERAKKLHVPHALLEKHITKETAKTVMWEELANDGMASGQAGKIEFDRRMQRRSDRAEKFILTEARHTMLEHQRKAFNMADSLFVFHKVQEDEPGTRAKQSILDLPDVKGIVKQSKNLSGAAKALKTRLRAVDANEKTLEKNAQVILDIMDQVEEREQKILEHYHDSFDMEPGEGPPRRHLEETLEVASKALKWLDIAEYRCSEGEVEAAAAKVEDSTDDEGGGRRRGSEEREEELRNNVAENAQAALERAQKRWGSQDGIDDGDDDDLSRSLSAGEMSGGSPPRSREAPPEKKKKGLKDMRNKLSIKGKKSKLSGVVDLAKARKGQRFDEDPPRSPKVEDTEQDKKAKEAAAMLSKLQPLEAAEKALELETDERGRAISFMETEQRTALLAALPLAIAAMPDKRKSMKKTYHKLKTGQFPTDEELEEDKEESDADANIDDLMKAWGIASDDEDEAGEVGEGTTADSAAEAAAKAKLKKNIMRSMGGMAAKLKKMQGLKPKPPPRSKSPAPAASPRSRSPAPGDSRPGTKGSAASRGSNSKEAAKAAAQAAEERCADLQERLDKLKSMMEQDLEREQAEKILAASQRDQAEAKVMAMELEITTLRSVMDAEQHKEEAEAAMAESTSSPSSDSSWEGGGGPKERKRREHKKRKREKERRRRDPEYSPSPTYSDDDSEYDSYSDYDSRSDSYDDATSPETDRSSPDQREERPRREKPKRDKPRREKRRKDDERQRPPRRDVTTPRSQRLPTPDALFDSGEEEDDFFEGARDDGRRTPQAMSDRGEGDEQDDVGGEEGEPREEREQQPRERTREKRTRERRERPERREREERQDRSERRERRERRREERTPRRDRKPQKKAEDDMYNELMGDYEDEQDEVDEEGLQQDESPQDEEGSDREGGQPARSPKKKLPVAKRRQQGAGGTKRFGRGPCCPKCGTSLEGLELDISSPEPASPVTKGGAKQGLQKMKNKITTKMGQKKATLANLTNVMKSAMRQSKEMILNAPESEALAAVLEAQAQAVAEVAKTQIEKVDEDIDVKRDLQARKAAGRLEKLAAREAAKLALEIPDEERGDAIGYMEPGKRTALLSVLPEVIIAMSAPQREVLFKEVADSREASRQASREASRQSSRQASQQSSRHASRQASRESGKEQKGLEGTERPEVMDVESVVAHIAQQAEEAAEREQGIPEEVRQTLENITSMTEETQVAMVEAQGSESKSDSRGSAGAEVGVEEQPKAGEAKPPESAESLASEHPDEKDEKSRTASEKSGSRDGSRGKDAQDSLPAPGISVQLPDDNKDDEETDTVSEMNKSTGALSALSGMSIEHAQPPSFQQGKRLTARPRPALVAKKKKKEEEVPIEEVAAHADFDPHGLRQLGVGLTPKGARQRSQSMSRMLKGDVEEEFPTSMPEKPETAEVEVQANGEGIAWGELPEAFINWLKENLVQREQAEFYCMPKTVTEIQWFDLNIIARERILADFEEFLKEIMARMMPARKRKKKGDKDSSGDGRNQSASPERDGRGRFPFAKPSPLNPQPFDEPAYDPYNWESTQRSLAQLMTDPNMAWLSLGGNRLVKITGPQQPLQEAASEEKAKLVPYPFFVQLDANGIPLQKLPGVANGRAPLESLLGTTSREMDNLEDGYIGIPDGALVMIGPGGAEYRPVRILNKPTPSPDAKLSPDAVPPDAENAQAAAEGETAEADKDKEKEGDKDMEKEAENETEKDKEKEPEQEEEKEPTEKPKPSTGETRAGLQQVVNAMERLYCMNMRSALDRMKPPTVLPRRMDAAETMRATRNPRNTWRGRTAVPAGKLASTGPVAAPSDGYVGCVSWNYKKQETQPAAEPEPEAPVMQQTQVKEPWTQAKAENLIRSLVAKEGGGKKLVDARQPGLPAFWPQPRKGSSAVGAKYEDAVKISPGEGFVTRTLTQTADSSSPNKPAGTGTSPPGTVMASEGGFDDAGIALSGPIAAGWNLPFVKEKEAGLPQINTPRYGNDVKGPVRGLKTSHEGARWGGTG